MNKKEFINGLLELELTFSNFEITNNEAKIKEWYSFFKDTDNEVFRKGIRKHIMTNLYPYPTIAHIMQCIKDISVEEYDSAEVAFEKICRLANRHNTSNLDRIIQIEKLDENDPMIKATRYLGLRTFFNNTITENQTKLKGREFIEVYKTILNEKVENDIQSGNLSIESRNNIKLEQNQKLAIGE